MYEREWGGQTKENGFILFGDRDTTGGTTRRLLTQVKVEAEGVVGEGGQGGQRGHGRGRPLVVVQRQGLGAAQLSAHAQVAHTRCNGQGHGWWVLGSRVRVAEVRGQRSV